MKDGVEDSVIRGPDSLNVESRGQCGSGSGHKRLS